MAWQHENNEFLEYSHGALKIFEHPKTDHRYCIGVDVSVARHGDYSCIQVLDHMGYQVATWHGHIDPFDFAEVVGELASYYVIMDFDWGNNHGLTTIRKLQDMGYPNLYVEQAVDDAYVDRLTRRAGLTTSKQNH